jgi:hypothetical protein
MSGSSPYPYSPKCLEEAFSEVHAITSFGIHPCKLFSFCGDPCSLHLGIWDSDKGAPPVEDIPCTFGVG